MCAGSELLELVDTDRVAALRLGGCDQGRDTFRVVEEREQRVTLMLTAAFMAISRVE